MNAMEWNRDLRWPLERIRRSEAHLTDLPDRGNGTVCLPEMRKGNVGLCVATQIARHSPYFHNLPGWSSPEQAWAQTQAQLAWYRVMTEQGQMTPIRNAQERDAHLKRWQESPPCDDGTPYVVESKTQPTPLPIGFVLSLEGADSIVTLDYLEQSYADGLRALGALGFVRGTHGRSRFWVLRCRFHDGVHARRPRPMRFQHARVHLKCYQAQQDTKSQVCFKNAYRQILHFLFSRAPGKDKTFWIF